MLPGGAILDRVQTLLRSLPVRFKVLVGGALPLLVVTGFGGLVATYHLQRAIGRQLDQGLRTTSGLIAGMVDTAAETTIRNHLRSVAETHRAHAEHLLAEVRAGRLKEVEARRRCLELLQAHRVGKTGYLYVIDPDGWVQAHPTARYIGTNTSHFPYVKQQLQLGRGYMEYEWLNDGESAPRAKALYMVPFEPWNWIISATSYREEFASLLDIEDFRAAIQSLRLENGGEPFILDRHGRMVFQSGSGRSGLAQAGASGVRPFLDEILRLRQGEATLALEVPDSSHPRLKRCHFQEIPELGWIVGATFDLQEAMQPMRALRQGFLVLALLSLLLAVPVTFWIAGRITRPLSALAQAFAGGYRTGVRVPVETQDEVGRLAEGFNRFVETLEEVHGALRDSEARYRGIFEHATEGIVQSRADGTLVQVNPGMVRLFGYDSAEALLQTRARDLYVQPLDRRRLVEGLERSEVQVVETEMRRQDGSRFWARVKAVGLRDSHGRLTTVEALVEDYRDEHTAAVLWVSHDPEQRERLGGRRLVIKDRRLEPEP